MGRLSGHSHGAWPVVLLGTICHWSCNKPEGGVGTDVAGRKVLNNGFFPRSFLIRNLSFLFSRVDGRHGPLLWTRIDPYIILILD